MDIIRTEQDGVVTLTMDDGAKNALDTDAFRAIMRAFDEAAGARAIVLAGREGIFSAGLNIKAMATMDRNGLHELLVVFGQALMQVWTHPTPVVAAATGHAIAGGTMFSMAADHAVAAEGEFFWGLTETQIDFELPGFGIALAKHNIAADRLEDLILPGRRIGVVEAVEAGYADELAPPDQVVARAQAVAAELAQLPARAYAGTKARFRRADADAVLAGLEADIDALLPKDM